ncbi:hypothetical protein MTR67_008424 [Solanum verrucosum]|uniref:Uncharacterized protein n=1 Tax=Solanum verrucosum TaxID=315347 RepID=A0AAF0TDX5_SOLVR|nr:hypothetical protein MTR67_008424 [Solanum verrucosum]
MTGERLFELLWPRRKTRKAAASTLKLEGEVGSGVVGLLKILGRFLDLQR